MASEEDFKSITDLYNRLLPAIKTKLDELNKLKITNIKEIDIWDYCLNNIWKYKEDLTIYEMVNDILYLDEINLLKFLRKE